MPEAFAVVVGRPSHGRVVAEKGPEYIRHCECNPLIKSVWQRRPPLAQPLYVGAVATTRAGSRFAGVIEDEFLILRSVNLSAQLWCAALRRFAKGVADCSASPILVPIWTGLRPNLVERMVVFHASFDSM